jgi:hypothetical protein
MQLPKTSAAHDNPRHHSGGEPMRIRRIDPISAAKVGGVLYAALGLVIGAFISLIVVGLGSVTAMGDEGGQAGVLGMLFGAGSIVILPIFYGIIGAVAMLVTALLYNLAAKIAGGLEIEVQQSAHP